MALSLQINFALTNIRTHHIYQLNHHMNIQDIDTNSTYRYQFNINLKRCYTMLISIKTRASTISQYHHYQHNTRCLFKHHFQLNDPSKYQLIRFKNYQIKERIPNFSASKGDEYRMKQLQTKVRCTF
ncbi:hypothetical protein ACJX0J_019496 [Zea mays]